MIDLKLIRKDDAPRSFLTLTIYTEIYEELKNICRKENIKISHLIRSLVNDFIESYRKGGKK